MNLARGRITLITARNGEIVTTLPFSDDFNRSNGDLSNRWKYSVGKWTINGNAAIGSPAMGVDEILSNGNMEAGNPPTGWSAVNGSIVGVADERTGGAGSQSISLTNASGTAAAYQSFAAAGWYYFSGWSKKITATYTNFGIGTISTNNNILSSGFQSWVNWTNAFGTFRSSTATLYALLMNVDAGLENRADDFSIRQFTNSHLFATRKFTQSDVDASVKASVTDKAQAGLCICLDNKDNPANYVVAYVDKGNGNRVKLDKCVNGVITELVNATVTYDASKVLRLVKNGLTFSVYYDGVQISTDKTITDNSIVYNKRHGLFSTYTTNTLEDYNISANVLADGALMQTDWYAQI